MLIRNQRRRGTAGRSLVLGVVLLPALSGAAWASGYQLREQSTTAQGNAFAGVAAGGEDISTMFFNPATMTQYSGNQTSFHVSYIAPEAEFENGSGTTFLGNSNGGSTSTNDIGEDAVVPAIYAMYQPAEDWRLGLSVNVPFGLATSYDRSWVGRYHAVRSELLTVNISPQVAYQPTDWLSLGAGVQVQYADAELSNAIDFGSIGAALGVSGASPGSQAQDGFGKLTGDDIGYGYSLGAVLEPLTGTQIGISYRSSVKHTLDGDSEFRLGDSGVGATVSAATGSFVDTGGRAMFKTPASVSIGLRQRIDDEWTVMGGLDWTEWSTFEELRIVFDNPAQSDSVTEEDWEDTWFAALGATYQPADTPWTFRAGVAYDEAPLETRTRTPRIPDSDRYWISGGVSYDPKPWLSVSATYTHIFVDEPELDLSTSDVGSTFRGNVSGEYDSSINILSVSAKVLF